MSMIVQNLLQKRFLKMSIVRLRGSRTKEKSATHKLVFTCERIAITKFR